MSTTLDERPGPADGDAGAGAVPVAPSGHRAHLDGLRAVAVYLVVAFHAGSERLSGGFIGVDVFFVLSGYLVTQVLLRDVAGAGGIRFGRFYARRARRLLPASMLALVVTALVWRAVASPAEVIASVGAFRASFLYVANWFFIDRSTGYFATDATQSPVLHYWSLAVEEQFYLVWPVLLGGLVWATGRLGRHRWVALRALIALGALASAGWAVLLRVDQPDRAYFGTDARAYQLLAGALLALTPSVLARVGRRPRTLQVVAPLALLGLVGLATDLVATGPIARGIGATALTGALLVTLDPDVGGPARWLLSTRPVTYLGQISYGTYLWHWPIIVVIAQVTEVAPLPLTGLVALLATGVASLSYHLVEMPIRRAPSLDRLRWPVALTGLALSLIAGLVVVPRLVEPAAPTTTTVAASTDTGDLTPVPDSFDQEEVYLAKFGETVDCVDRPPGDCTVVDGSGPHILLMGDSNAQMWIPAFTRMAEDEDLTLSLAVTPGCLWQRRAYKLGAEIRAACRRTKEDAYERVIPALDPDVIVVVNAREPPGPPRPTYRANPLSRVVREDTPVSIDALLALTRDVVVIEAAPTPVDDTFEPLDCLAEAEVVEECRFVTSTETSWIELQEREIAGGDERVRTADLDRLICPFLPICDPIIGGTTVFWNGQHITTAYSETLAPEVGRYLTDEGLIPSRPG